jgi:hypothetical protein
MNRQTDRQQTGRQKEKESKKGARNIKREINKQTGDK